MNEIPSSVVGRSTEAVTPWEDMLKESMIRSLYRDSDKLLLTQDEQHIGRLMRKIEEARKERECESKNTLDFGKQSGKNLAIIRRGNL